MAVVKADAYGHGAAQIARTALDNGASRLAVARLEEGIEIRKAGIDAPILVFGVTPPEDLESVLFYNLTPSAGSPEEIRALAASAGRARKQLKLHIKVDTGMGRLGFKHEGIMGDFCCGGTAPSAAEEIAAACARPRLEIEGIYTHFASSDSRDKTYAKQQFEHFSSVLDELESRGVQIPIRHAANSAAIIDMPETHLDMVRPGIALYGLQPSPETGCCRDYSIRPAMSLRSIIARVCDVPAGFKVSYGSTYETPRKTKIAAVPVGYADGYNRRLSNHGCMLVKGQKAPVVGRICMDLTMIDVGHISGVQPGDEVTILGTQGDQTISADELAADLSTINYEIVSAVAHRVPRIYKKSLYRHQQL